MEKIARKTKRNVIKTNEYVYARGPKKSVLLVAHADTVQGYGNKQICTDTNRGIVWSPDGLGADDRAGVYAIAKLATEAKCGFLITTGEEIGGIGASAFLAKYENELKRYAYMIELDRKGSKDCVFYECNNKKFKNYIESFGFKEAQGSFSDISTLMESGVCAVNLSIGYYHQHTPKEYLNLREMNAVIKKVKKMCSQSKKKYRFEWNAFSNYKYQNGYSFYRDSYFKPKPGNNNLIENQDNFPEFEIAEFIATNESFSSREEVRELSEEYAEILGLKHLFLDYELIYERVTDLVSAF
jgi:hypothetical protein